MSWARTSTAAPMIHCQRLFLSSSGRWLLLCCSRTRSSGRQYINLCRHVKHVWLLSGVRSCFVAYASGLYARSASFVIRRQDAVTASEKLAISIP
jgi:hypothetical protein